MKRIRVSSGTVFSVAGRSGVDRIGSSVLSGAGGLGNASSAGSARRPSPAGRKSSLCSFVRAEARPRDASRARPSRDRRARSRSQLYRAACGSSARFADASQERVHLVITVTRWAKRSQPFAPNPSRRVELISVAAYPVRLRRAAFPRKSHARCTAGPAECVKPRD